MYIEFGTKQNAKKHTNKVRHLKVYKKTHRYKKHYKNRTPTIFFLISKQKTDQHHCHPCNSNTFTMMCCCNNDKKVRRKSYCGSRSQTNPLVNTKRTQQYKKADKIEKNNKNGITGAPLKKTRKWS